MNKEQHFKQTGHPKNVRPLIPIMAVLILAACGFCIGAFVLLCPTSKNPDTQQEAVTLEEIGLTLIFPDSWRGKYSITENDGNYVIYNTQIREAVSQGIDAFDGGVLFYIVCYEEVMTPEQFVENGYDYTGYRYLFSTDDSTYILYYASDVQWDTQDPEQEAEYTQMVSEIKDIEFIVDAALMD